MCGCERKKTAMCPPKGLQTLLNVDAKMLLWSHLWTDPPQLLAASRAHLPHPGFMGGESTVMRS